MKPRLASSKKWTAFPPEFLQQIDAVFRENFSKELKSAELIVEGRIYPQEILVRIGYLEAGRLKQANFEVSVEYSQEKNDAIQRINDAVDAAASLMVEYFENEKNAKDELDFPLIWKEVPFNNGKLHIQFSTVNTKLEAQADALLGIKDENLVKDQPTEEEIEETLADEEEDGDSSPRMFGGGKKKKDQLH